MASSSNHQEQRVLKVLAHAPSELVSSSFEALHDVPDWEFIRQPEAGLVMVRGRISGTGAPFNVGEVTGTRAAVTTASGETGFSYALGRDKKKAEQAAIIHALWRQPQRQNAVENEIIEPLEQALAQQETQVREEVASTKVDFFTMVRGDD